MRISDWSSDVCSSDLFGYQTEDLLPAVAEAGYFVGCASRLMANDLILVCADAARNPAWGLFLVSRVGPEGVILENVAGLTPDTINGLTFLRSPLGPLPVGKLLRSEEHTSELQSLMRISYAVFCLKKKQIHLHTHVIIHPLK